MVFTFVVFVWLSTDFVTGVETEVAPGRNLQHFLFLVHCCGTGEGMECATTVLAWIPLASTFEFLQFAYF